VTIKGTATKRASPQGAPNLFLIREWAHRKRRKKTVPGLMFSAEKIAKEKWF
jgi:hypothetical protein